MRNEPKAALVRKQEFVLGGDREQYRRGLARSKLKLKGVPTSWANIGQHHEDYGMSAEEHAFAKAHRSKDSRARDEMTGADRSRRAAY